MQAAVDQKPVIIIADDWPDILKPFVKSLQMRFPDTLVVGCSNAAECSDAFKQYEGRIAAILLDGEMEKYERDGIKLAESVRAGDYGAKLQAVPMAVLSGDRRFVEAEPPVFLITKPAEVEDLEDFIKNYAFGSEAWKWELEASEERLKPIRAQQSRDHNAQMVIDILLPDIDGFGRQTHSSNLNSFVQNTHDIKVGKELVKNQAALLRGYLEAAFDTGIAIHEMLRSMLDAADHAALHFPDDGTANQYALLKSRVRTQALNALSNVDPWLVEHYNRGRQ